MFNKWKVSWGKLVITLILLGLYSVFPVGAVFAAGGVEGIQVYQKNVHLVPEHKQKLADDISRYRNADNLWDVLREEFTLPHYEDSPAVQEKIEWYMNNQDFLLRSASRAAPYLYYILQQVKVRHLPAELVLLPIVESGYNPFNRSPVGAVGIWQLMPDTASGLGIKQDWWYDGRRDIIASTRAALNYLAYLQSFFDGNWLLAMAAYNTGEGNVLSAIKRNVRDGINTSFWSLPIAQETRDYVPSILALAVIISHPDRYPIYLPPVRNAPYLAQIDIGTQINLKYAAGLAGISYDKMKRLNPGFKSLMTSMKGPYKLVVPIENVEQFTENFSRSSLNQRPLNWVHYKIKSGDTLASVARKFNIETEDIRKLNRLSSKGIKNGMSLLIPINSNTSVAMEDADDEIIAVKKRPLKELALVASKSREVQTIDLPLSVNMATGQYSLQPGDTIYMTRSKDSVESIAKRFHISTNMLRTANQLSSNKITPGKQLIIPTHSRMVEEASVFKSSKNSVLPGDTIYMVRHGDTIEKVAKKFRTTPSEIRLANLMVSNQLHEGERIVVPTHVRG